MLAARLIVKYKEKVLITRYGDARSSDPNIKLYYRLVDVWHVGELNHMQPPKPIDWIEAMREIMGALESVKAKYKFKKSFTDL